MLLEWCERKTLLADWCWRLLLKWCERKILLAGWRPLEQNRVNSILVLGSISRGVVFFKKKLSL